MAASSLLHHERSLPGGRSHRAGWVSALGGEHALPTPCFPLYPLPEAVSISSTKTSVSSHPPGSARWELGFVVSPQSLPGSISGAAVGSSMHPAALLALWFVK